MTVHRSEIPLDDDWEFAYAAPAGHSEGVPSPPPESRFDSRMPVPGYWDDHTERLSLTKFWSRDSVFNPAYRAIRFPMGTGKPADASLPYLIGVGWYRTRFRHDAEPGDSVVIEVGGVALEAWLWVNGRRVHHHVGHLTPFEVDITDDIVSGENVVMLAVSNVRDDRIGCSIRGFAGHSGGITRPVRLRVTGRSRIADAFVHGGEDLSALHWSIDIASRGEPDEEMRLVWRVESEPDGTLIGEGTEYARPGSNHWTTSADGIDRWSDRDPNLHRLRVSLLAGDELLDERSWRFGLRALHADGTGLRLNGRPILLRGATDHAYFPETTTVPTSLGFYRSTLRRLQLLGFNWIRFHTWTPPEECLIAADELGMLLQVEAPNGFLPQDWRDILRTCRNHPSVVLYCAGNEVRMDAAMLDQLAECGAEVAQHAPGTLFNPMEGLRNVEYELDVHEDGYSASPHPHHAGRLERLEEIADVVAPHGAIFSYHSLSTDAAAVERRLSLHERPSLMHEIGINDSFLDLGLEQRYAGTRAGADLFASARQQLDRFGLLDRAPVYFRNSSRWQQLTAKFSIENARRSSRIAGYDYLGGIDCHWHRSGYAVGMMNEFYETKPGFEPEAVLRYNGESVLLADCGRERNLQGGSTRAVQMHASLFGGSDVDEAELSWRLRDDSGRILDRGSRPVRGLTDGTVSALGEIEFHAPALARAAHVTLEATLSGARCHLDNRWDFWIFPPVRPLDASGSADVRVLESLDEESIRWMNEGGRVLLLGAAGLPAFPTTFQIMSGGRTQGSNATVVHEHPMLNGFPHEGFCDWQFAALIESASAAVFTAGPIPFDPIIEVVSGYKVVRPQAALFEVGVGAGGFVSCTLDLGADDPGARFLRSLLENHLRSDRFAPRTRVTGDELLLLESSPLDVDLSTDEGYDDGGHVRAR